MTEGATFGKMEVLYFFPKRRYFPWCSFNFCLMLFLLLGKLFIRMYVRLVALLLLSLVIPK